MAKLTRKNQKIFAGEAQNDQRAIFGTMKTNSPQYSNDVETLQSNDYTLGFSEAIQEDKAPYLEETNAVLYGLSYQVAYLLQNGVAEWKSDQTYYINQVAMYNGLIYQSTVDNNINSIPSSLVGWKVYLSTELNAKVNSSFDNLTTTGFEALAEALSPDHQNGIKIATNSTGGSYTAPDYGYIMGNMYTDNGDMILEFGSPATTIMASGQGGDGENRDTFFCVISKGQYIRWRRTGSHSKFTAWFIPCKGV